MASDAHRKVKDIYRPWGGKFPHPELEQEAAERSRIEKLREDPALQDFLFKLDMSDDQPN